MYSCKLVTIEKQLEIKNSWADIENQNDSFNGQTHNSRSTSYVNSAGLVTSSFIHI
jgi:hypothetical protein